ncbi:hypothetical protein QUF74_18580 [Candidatus Halobeggiatoa sp. HSG11]|nr:hypothetical protein [Candidatus Halobeggiatoa sp. HSG11]
MLSDETDFVVHKKSARLDNIPYEGISGAVHTELTNHERILEKALDYLGRDPEPERTVRRPSPDIGDTSSDILENEQIDNSKMLSGHIVYVTDVRNDKELPILQAKETQEQEFEVDSTNNNLRIILIGSIKNDVKPSLKLLSPSGTVIDENTALPNVEYNDESTIYINYRITEVESNTFSPFVAQP